MQNNSYLQIVKNALLSRIDCTQYAVFLFGSRANDTSHQKSDIDIGILGHSKLSSFLKFELENSLENSRIPLKIDLVDFFDISPTFKKEALTHIQLWNLPNDIMLI